MPPTVFPEASGGAGASAAAGEPPAAITDTNENCEAPVKATTDITHVWATLKPAATERTPNETAYRPVSSGIDRALRSTWSGAARCVGVVAVGSVVSIG